MTDNEPDEMPDESTDSTEENPCPAGYIWDHAKQECVAIIINEEEN